MSDLPDLYALNTLLRSWFTRRKLSHEFSKEYFFFISHTALRMTGYYIPVIRVTAVQCLTSWSVLPFPGDIRHKHRAWEWNERGTGKPSLGGGWAVQKRRDFRQIFPLTQLAKPAGTLKFNWLYWINTDFLKDNTQKLNAIMRVRTFVKQNAVSIFDWP